jgi:hypothetical protein
MPNSPKENISLYREEQVEAYERAKAELAARGVDVEDLSRGDVLATLAADYTEVVSESESNQEPETTIGRSDRSVLLRIFIPVLAFILWVATVGAVAVVTLT